MDIHWHFVIASLIRLSFLLYGHLQDAWFKVKYTDIDYQVFTDASKYMSEGLSPFKRCTYRYTPLLSFMLLPNIMLHESFGKVMFCALDIFAGLLIYKIQHRLKLPLEVCRMSTFISLYNPLPIVISTRGNAESIMTCLIMLVIYTFQTKSYFTMGLVYGLAVHFKIYPCIYAVSLYFALSPPGCIRLMRLLYPDKEKIIFVLASVIGFAIPTVVSLALYGTEYLNEALLYHVTRKDTRHNFSPYFYVLYLTQSSHEILSSIISITAFAVQAILILFISYSFPSAQTLPVCMFIETLVFVTYNKVCTSQYFLWYLCLLPLCFSMLSDKVRSLGCLFAIWMFGQGLWLLPAYYLEFEGKNTFLYVCLSSLIFFGINVYCIYFFIKCLILSINSAHIQSDKTR